MSIKGKYINIIGGSKTIDLHSVIMTVDYESYGDDQIAYIKHKYEMFEMANDESIYEIKNGKNLINICTEWYGRYVYDDVYVGRVLLYNEYIKIFDFLIKKGVDINNVDNNGYSPLSRAIERADYAPELPGYLIENGAEANISLHKVFCYPFLFNIKQIYKLFEMADDESMFETINEENLINSCIRAYSHYVGKDEDEDKHNEYIKIFDFLLKKGVDINNAHLGGNTPLAEAIRLEYKKLCEYLIKNGAKINLHTVDMSSGTPDAPFGTVDTTKNIYKLFKIFKMADDESILEIKNGDNLINVCVKKYVNYFGYNESHQENEHNEYIKILDYLLKKGVDINNVGDDGNSPFIIAILNKSKRLVEYLIKKGAKIENKTTLFSKFVENGEYDSAKMMVDFGIIEVGTDVKYEYLNNSLIDCLARKKNGNFSYADFLISLGADINYKDEKNMSILMYASVKCYYDVVNYLIKHNVNINAVNDNGETALMYATIRPCRIVELLLKNGADPNIKTVGGQTALLWLAHDSTKMYMYFTTVKKYFDLLIKYNADIEVRDNNGKDILYYAVGGVFMRIIINNDYYQETQLIKYIIELKIKNNYDLDIKSALEYAKEKQLDKVVDILIKVAHKESLIKMYNSINDCKKLFELLDI
jgi:ankyrin repeat protein